MPIVDINGQEVEFPDDMAPEQLQQAVAQAAGQVGKTPASWKTTAASFYRPVLEIGGAVGGAALATPLTPAGQVAAGGLGFAGGRAAANLIDRGLGLKKPLNGLKEIAAETASDIGAGAVNEMGGQVLKAIPSKATEAFLAKTAGVAGRIQSGVREKAGERLFRNPKALFAPSTESVGKELGLARDAAGMTAKPTVNEIVDTEGSIARRVAKNVLSKIEDGEKPTAVELLKGKQAVNKLLEKLPFNQRNQRRLLSQAGQKLSDSLYDVAPEERKLAAKYAEAALGEEFKRFYPVTKTGDVSLTRTLFLPALSSPGQALAAIPAVLGQSPALGGAAIASAGGAYKGLQSMLGPSQMRRALVSAIQAAIAQRKTQKEAANAK